MKNVKTVNYIWLGLITWCRNLVVFFALSWGSPVILINVVMETGDILIFHYYTNRALRQFILLKLKVPQR